MGYESAISTQLLATHCVYCGQPLRDPASIERGVGPECWEKHFMIDRPLPKAVDREKMRAAMELAPEPLRSRWRQMGGDPKSNKAPWATDQEVQRQMVSVGLHHGAIAASYGSDPTETIANRVDSAMLVITTVQNFASGAGYRHTADRMAKRYAEEAANRDAIIFKRDPKAASVLGVHTPVSDEWIRLTKTNRGTFFKAEYEQRGRRRLYFRYFHERDLRTVVNMLQAIFGDAYCLNPDGDLMLLPSMPLPEELPAPPGDQPKLRATGELPKIDREVDKIKLGDTVTLPDGSTSNVQFIDPKKRRIGVGPRKRRQDDTDYSYTFFSFEQVQESDGRQIATDLFEARKKGRAEEGAPPPERVKLPRKIPDVMRPYQIEALDFIEKNGRVILAFEQGLGKTMTAIVATDTPAICVVPALLKVNWVNELSQWRPELSTTLVEGSKPPPMQARKADVIVINYDILDKHLEWLLAFGAKTLIADEAQALKNFGAYWEARERRFVPTDTTTLRARAFYELHWNVPKLLLLTGTPIMNRTKEIWPLLHMCNKEEWGSMRNFQTVYCGGREEKVGGRQMWKADGRTNAPELHQRLVARYMVRRTKAEVAKDLPAKSRRSIAVSMDLEHKKMYARVVRDFLRWIEENGGPERAERVARAEMLVRMTALRRIAANGKAPAAINWIKEHWEGTQRPLVVMGVHADALDKIAAGIDEMNKEHSRALAAGDVPDISKPIRYGRITGNVPKGKRQKTIEDFQKNGTLDLVLYSIPIATGTTLTRASEVLFIERLWRPADQVQAEDRVHRLGQTLPVSITYLDACGTIDDKMALLLMDKAVTAAAVIDGVDLDAKGAQDLVYGEMFGFDAGEAYNADDYDISDLIDDAAAGLVDLEREIEAEEEELERNAAEEPLDELEQALGVDSSWDQPL